MAARGLRLLALAVLCACACGGGAGSAARPSATPTSAPTSVVTTQPSAGTGGNGGAQDTGGSGGTQLDRCHTIGLSLTALSQPSGGAGNFVQEFGLINRSGSACSFLGYVGMAMIDAGGDVLPTHVVRDTGTRFPFAHRAQYTVQPGATAPFWVHWATVPSAAQPGCTTSAGLLVTPPDETTQLRLDGVQITACGGGELDVSPVTAPGTTGP